MVAPKPPMASSMGAHMAPSSTVPPRFLGSSAHRLPRAVLRSQPRRVPVWVLILRVSTSWNSQLTMAPRIPLTGSIIVSSSSAGSAPSLRIAPGSRHLIGAAQTWYYALEQDEGMPSWERFKELCKSAFWAGGSWHPSVRTCSPTLPFDGARLLRSPQCGALPCPESLSSSEGQVVCGRPTGAYQG
jgi:hypothetical protein